MSKIPEDIRETSYKVAADIATSRFKTSHLIARAILAERKRCADWCDKTAFLEWEQGELRAQRALQLARDNILSGDDA